MYVEIVLFNNLALDALLILCTLTLRRKKAVWWRVLFSSVIGAGVAVGYAVAPEVWKIVIRIVLAPILCALFAKYGSVRDYLITLAVFALLTFALGGITEGISHLTGVALTGYITLGLIAAGAVILLISVRAFAAKRSKAARKIIDIKLSVHGRELNLKAMCDTGNALTDSVTGFPVIIASEKAESQFMIDGGCKEIEGYIEVKTISGESSMPIVRLDGIEVEGRRCSAYAALSRQSFEGYDIILQNTLF